MNAHRLALAAKRALALADQMAEAYSATGHDGNPPSWDKKCARCAWFVEQRQALERVRKQIAKHSK